MKRKTLLYFFCFCCFFINSFAVNAFAGSLVVTTMTDSEGQILGQILVQTLRAHGFDIDDRTGTLNATSLGRAALLEKQTDIYIDYTGRGLFLINGVDEKLFTDLESAYQTVKKFDEAHGLIWLQYAPFSNTDSLAVSRSFSTAHNMKTMEDFAAYVNSGGEVKLITQAYWVKLKTGLPGMQEAYGFTLKDDQVVVMNGHHEDLLDNNSDGINVSAVFSTAGTIEALDLQLLEDTKHVSPCYSPSPIIQKTTLDTYPEIASIIEPIFASISLEDMLAMNEKLDIEGQNAGDIAKEYLEKKGFK